MIVDTVNSCRIAFCDGNTVEPVISSHSREAKKLAAKGRWLLNAG